jgi:rhodanese-related sulfurtransferase
MAQDQPEQWKASEMATPAQIAAELKTNDPARHVFYVGFPILYKGAHIPAAKFAGPCSKPEGVALLEAGLKDVPHDAEVIIYCGCCPFVKCPNIRPAYKALAKLGYTNIKVLELETNLHTDWVEKGYPIEQSK